MNSALRLGRRARFVRSGSTLIEYTAISSRLPPKVVAAIGRQQDALTARSRSIAAKALAKQRKDAGHRAWVYEKAQYNSNWRKTMDLMKVLRKEESKLSAVF